MEGKGNRVCADGKDKSGFGEAEVQQPPPEEAFPTGEGGPGAARDG